MTLGEATEQLFAAAKNGDTAAAQAALDAGANVQASDGRGHDPVDWARINGHTNTYELLKEKSSAIDAARQRRESDAGALGMVMGGLLAAAFYFGVVVPDVPFFLSPKDKTANKQPLPKDVEAAQQQLRSALKDPAITERLIEQLKDASLIEKFTADPDIMRNLRTLADAIDGNTKGPPRHSWMDKAIQGNVESPTR